MGHEIYISREKTGLGHANAAGLIKKSINKALTAEGIAEPHRNHKPRAIKGTRKSGIILYRHNEATAQIVLLSR